MKAFVLALCLAAPPGAAFAQLKPGAPAPDFSVPAALAGKDIAFSLADALKKGPVVLYFYPKSFTKVCTDEAHEFAEATDEFAKMGASVIGLSGDTIATQREFSSLECRDKFAVGADADLKVAKAYEAAAGQANFARRISYVIAPDGRIASALVDPGATKHIQNALAAVKALSRK